MNLETLPRCMLQLPRDHAGRPVPYFASWTDGKPDFRVASLRAMRSCLKHGLSWVCGQPIYSRDCAFPLGPMCVVSRVTAEPPSHIDCATWSALNCPFLSRPGMTRRDRNMPEDTIDPAGVMVTRNPGVTAVWVTGRKSWSSFPAPGGVMFSIGPLAECRWYANGRGATRGEILESIETGMPILRDAADLNGTASRARLEEQYRAALSLLPAETAP